MQELIRTNDAVLLSFIRSLLDGQEISYHVADEAFSSVEGSLSIFPRRVLVDDDDADRARTLLKDAGVQVETG